MTPGKPLRALMVDLDGTLAQTSKSNVRAYQQALQEYGVIISSESLEARVGGRHWKQFLPAILSEKASHADPAAIAARKAAIYAERLHEIQWNTGLIKLLRSCKSTLHIALVTSASRTSVEALLRVHALHNLFEVIITGDDVVRHKPDPEAYLLAAERLGVHPEETLIYEDSDIGVQSAESFGGHVIRVIF